MESPGQPYEVGALVQRGWPASPDIMGGKADKRGFTYQAFVPDPIAKLERPGANPSLETLEKVMRALGARLDLRLLRPV
jgi:hypothetical protein